MRAELHHKLKQNHLTHAAIQGDGEPTEASVARTYMQTRRESTQTQIHTYTYRHSLIEVVPT